MKKPAAEKLSLLILAAGMGSRYRGLKQIDPVGPRGELVMDYSIYDALGAGFNRLVFVVRREFESEFKKAIGSKFEQKAEVVYVYQALDQVPAGFRIPPTRVKPWGTGQAVLAAQPVIHEPFAVINADDFYGRQGFQRLADFLRSPAPAQAGEYALVGFTLRNTLSDFGPVSRGICRCDRNSRLQSVTELTRLEKDGAGAVHRDDLGRETRLTGDEWVSMNMWGFRPSAFPLLQEQFARFLAGHGQEDKSEFYIPMAVDELIHQGQARVRLLPSPEEWFGVTHPGDKALVVSRLQKRVEQGVYPAPLWG